MRFFERRAILCVFAAIAIITGCVKNSNTPILTPTTSTIAQIVKLGSNLTILDSALSKSGLLQNLDTSTVGSYTLFAPVDQAFLSAGFADSTVARLSKDSLRNFLSYYIYYGQNGLTLSGGGLPIGPNAPLGMITPGDTVFCSIINGSGYINGTLITQSDVIAKNGVIQALGGLYFPPIGNIMTTIQSDTTLSFLDTAILRASQSDTNFVMLLTSGLYTIFAPTNNAFRQAGYASSTVLYSMNADSMARLVTTHILAGRVFTSSFSSIDTLYSYDDQDSLFVSAAFGTIQSKGDSTASNLGPVNIAATNGLIHKVSQVLFPFYPF